jgi:hypothetical protein
MSNVIFNEIGVIMNINRRQAIKLTSATVIAGGISLFSLCTIYWTTPR